MKRILSLMLAVVMMIVPSTVSMAAESTSAVPYTESVGEEPNRYVVIKLKEEQ